MYRSHMRQVKAEGLRKVAHAWHRSIFMGHNCEGTEQTDIKDELGHGQE